MEDNKVMKQYDNSRHYLEQVYGIATGKGIGGEYESKESRATRFGTLIDLLILSVKA